MGKREVEGRKRVSEGEVGRWERERAYVLVVAVANADVGAVAAENYFC